MGCRKMDYFAYILLRGMRAEIRGEPSRITISIKTAREAISLIVEKPTVRAGERNA
jgi:hypothetical protein